MKELLQNIFIGIIIFFICATFIYMIAPKTDSKGTINTLTNEGYKNIEITGYGYFKCSDSDSFSTSFTAINLAGNKVNGTVCSGFLKGSIISLN